VGDFVVLDLMPVVGASAAALRWLLNTVGLSNPAIAKVCTWRRPRAAHRDGAAVAVLDAWRWDGCTSSRRTAASPSPTTRSTASSQCSTSQP